MRHGVRMRKWHDTGGEPSGMAAEDRPCHIASARAVAIQPCWASSRYAQTAPLPGLRRRSAVAARTGCVPRDDETVVLPRTVWESASLRRRDRATEYARKAHVTCRPATQNAAPERARSGCTHRRARHVLKGVRGPAPPVRDRSMMIAARMETELDSVAPLSSHPDPRVADVCAAENGVKPALPLRTDQV